MDDKHFADLREMAIPLRATVPGVYLLFQGDRLVYVGHSWNCFLGVAEQTRKERPKAFDSWSYVREPDEEKRRALVDEFKKRLAP